MLNIKPPSIFPQITLHTLPHIRHEQMTGSKLHQIVKNVNILEFHGNNVKSPGELHLNNDNNKLYCVD